MAHSVPHHLKMDLVLLIIKMRSKTLKPKVIKQLKPIDVELSEQVLLEIGSVIVTLRTFDDLNKFREKNRHIYLFAAQCVNPQTAHSLFLKEYQWIFAKSKTDLIKTLCKWDEVGIKCVWYNWKKKYPHDHADFFNSRCFNRDSCINEGEWSEEDEREYQIDIIERTPETYSGYWILENLPGGISDLDWFSINCAEIIDKTIPISSVIEILQEETFNSWHALGGDEIELLTADEVDKEIAYWRIEQVEGREVYGESL